MILLKKRKFLIVQIMGKKMSETEILSILSDPPAECQGCNIVSCFPQRDKEKNIVTRCVHYRKIAVITKIKKMLGYNGNRPVSIPRFEDLKFDINDIKRGVEKIKNFSQSFNNLLFVVANPGTGKSHCLIAKTYELLMAGESAYYIEARMLHYLWRQQINSEISRDELNEFFNFSDSEYKIIDDIGRGEFTDFFEDNLRKLLNSWHDKFIIASNLDPEGEEPFKLKIKDAALLSRLTRERNGEIVRWTGKDYRKIKQED